MDLRKIKGVGEVAASKLEKYGIIDVDQLMTKSPYEISQLTGIDSEAAADLFFRAREALKKDNQISELWEMATAIEKQRLDAKKFTTGAEAIDNMLLGGIETDAITEVYGEFGAGKSQLSHTFAVSVQLPEDKKGLSKDGEDVRVAWIDTENTFRPERIRAIAIRFGLDPDKVMSNIKVARVHNTVEQMDALEQIEKVIKSENIKLIVVDSAIGLFRGEYIGRGNLSNRQGAISRFVHLGEKIAMAYHLAVIYTNQVQSDPSQMFGDPTKSVGGRVVEHTSTYRIYLKKSGKFRVAVMKDSPHHPDGECVYGVTEGGVVDKVLKEAEIKEAEKVKKAAKKDIEEEVEL
ncbi:MAG: DNA repair and recombination protein RadA [Candidatus Micrarchaeota archaeon]|nr:DNA repair and recombination protein RadA [Candidatus Micrarchaeota archaeon]